MELELGERLNQLCNFRKNINDFRTSKKELNYNPNFNV